MKEFYPRLDILRAAQMLSVIQVRAEAKDYLDVDAMIRLGQINLPTALAAAQVLYGPTFNPELSLKALSFFDDGNLRELPDDLKERLVVASRDVDLDDLPAIEGNSRRIDYDNGLEL
jgi:hypothetical protein